ncbi:MAG: DNA polymerase III subunit alpha [Patescibacteria group bacterium]
MKFTHLHNHSHYSLLDGVVKIDELIKATKEDGQTALALTDHGVMYGVIEFYQKCKKAGIKPIIGLEAYVAPNSRFDKNAKSDEKNYYHLLLLAKDKQGYNNLIKLTTIAHLEGFYYKPRIDFEILQKYNQGLIACTGCLGGEIPKLILSNKIDKAREKAVKYNKLFGQDNFYLEIMHHPDLEGCDYVNEQLVKFSKELNIPLVATHDTHYLEKEDEAAQDILLCLQNKKKKEDKNRMNMSGVDYSFKTSKEMAEYFQDTPDAISNTARIAEKCNLEIELGNIQLPFFQVPDNYDGDEYLKKLTLEGLLKRYNKNYKEVDEVIKERINYELSVIQKMGWSSYFLIVADVVNWAKSNGIIVGPGRGSAPGSIICYLTGITNLDPLKYNLLFERFLNPERVSMPDIDMDFSDARRDDVIHYIEEKYGKDHVAQIITFGTMAARVAIRDVGRVLHYPYDYCDKLAKMIPALCKIDKALKIVSELRAIYQQEEAARIIIDYARRLEGVARHSSTHACGVLITKKPLNNYVPLQYVSSSDKTIISQYSLHPIEDLGLLKIDVLGLKNLTIIETTINILKNADKINVDINKIPLDDQKTYQLFQKGETTGVFQFESSGMKRCLKELKPTEFEDIIAMVALYRPGPMEWIPDYIARKKGRKKIKYLHHKLEPILNKTHGVAIYQEQIMQVVRDLAGFSMGEADILRRAVGKKIPKLLGEQKEKFIEGCVRNSIPSELAENIFSFIEPFAGYGFNRSHAACYALIGYQTAYLKAHWPEEFMAALLTSDQRNIDKIGIKIEECRNMGIDIMPPDINESFSSFTVVNSRENIAEKQKKSIRFGLMAVKNVGEHITEVIINERKKNKYYKDIFDFIERITDKDMNKKSLESLIKSGSLDQFGERGQFLSNIDILLNFNKQSNNSKRSGQGSLFADTPALAISNQIKLIPSEPADNQQKLIWEKELLGLYISEHPFNVYKKYLQNIIVPLENLKNNYSKNNIINIAGVISVIKKIMTRKNEPMLFVKIENAMKSIEVLVFPRLLQETSDIWEENKAVICQGKLSDKDQEIKMLVNRVAELNLENIQKIVNSFGQASVGTGADRGLASGILEAKPLSAPVPTTLHVAPITGLKLIFNKNLTTEKLNLLKKLLIKNPGNDKVYFQINQNNKTNILETGLRVGISDNLISEINREFEGIGIENK